MRLNPSLQRWTTPGNDPGFVLNLPAGTKDLYEQTIASVPPDKRVWWRAHKVVEGETLAAVAKQFRISPVTLAQANQLATTASLESGAHLVVPMAAGNEASLARFRERVPLRVTHYRVRPGDTVDLIADRFNVTAFQIRRWNGLRSSRLTPGRTLRLYVEGPAGTTSQAAHTRSRSKSKQLATHPVTAHKKPAAAHKKPVATAKAAAPAAARATP